MPHSESFVRPSLKPKKELYQMPLDELRQACNENHLEFLRQKANSQPDNQDAAAEYRSYCLTRDIDPDTGKKSRFASMSKEQIGTEWETAGKQQEASELESYRDKQASLFLASQPKYQPSQENSDKIVQELERQGLRGSVYDINNIFLQLVERGEITPKFIPELDAVPLHSREEMYSLSMDELRALAEQTNR